MRCITIAIFSLLLTACGNKKKETRPVQAEARTIHLPYAPRQTADFEMGNPAFTKVVLDVWRGFDRGNISGLKAQFAQQLTIMLPDQYLQGNRDTVLAQWQKKRDAYTTVQTMVDSWVPLHASDTKENFVFVWGKRQLTEPGGKVLHRTILEKWRVNGQGLIDFMQQYVNESYDAN